MSIRDAIPYLMLGGKSHAAIAYYERAFGARADTVLRFGDVDEGCPDAQRDRIMHAELRAGDARFMLSDGPDGPPPPASDAVMVALSCGDEPSLRACFEGLSAEGEVVIPPHDTPLGDLLAGARDPFGVLWMLHCAKEARD
jgi:PhnB protein